MCEVNRKYRRIAGVGLLLCGVFLGCSSQGGFYVTPEHVDLGVISGEKRVAIAEFEIVNGLDHPVKISHLFPSCQCTNVALSSNPVPAGKSVTLRAVADFSGRAGRQDFSVTFVTDSAEFPSKRVSFTAFAAAEGTREREVSLGTFYPGSRIDMPLSITAFSQGAVDQMEEISGIRGDELHARLGDIGGKTMLLLNGEAPTTPGVFSKRFRFRELFPEKPELGEGVVELNLTGNVVARWKVSPVLYLGFVSLRDDAVTKPLVIKRDFASSTVRDEVAAVTVTFADDALTLKDYSVVDDQISLHVEFRKDKRRGRETVESAMKIAIRYSDGNVEKYSSTIFARIVD